MVITLFTSPILSLGDSSIHPTSDLCAPTPSSAHRFPGENFFGILPVATALTSHHEIIRRDVGQRMQSSLPHKHGNKVTDVIYAYLDHGSVVLLRRYVLPVLPFRGANKYIYSYF